MRISPINLKYNQNMQLKKAQQHNKQNSPSFGHFESPDIENELENVLGKPLWDLDKIDIKKVKNSPFVTVKKGHDKEGQTMLYAVMNKDVTDKHKNKEFFDKMLKNCKELVELGALSYLDIIEAGIPEKEPYFIGPVSDSEDLGRLCANIYDAETGYVYAPPKDANSNSYKQDNDPWLEAVWREIPN